MLGALLGVLALLAVGHAIATGVRRRHRELALLKTLGFERRQIRATIFWQATAIGAVGLAVGLPLGGLAGAAIWRRIANGLGVASTVTVPFVAFALLALGLLLVVNLVALVPAWAAARTQPGVALRAE